MPNEKLKTLFLLLLSLVGIILNSFAQKTTTGKFADALQGFKYAQDSSRLLGVAMRIVRDKALAEDVVHDAFIKVWRGASSFDPSRGAARGWVFSITRHLALNAVRNHYREVALSDEHEHVTAAENSFEFSAREGRIYHCLEQLDPARRTCILHAYVDGYSHSEIAQKLDTPLGTVKAWIKRSLTALRECMA